MYILFCEYKIFNKYYKLTAIYKGTTKQDGQESRTNCAIFLRLLDGAINTKYIKCLETVKVCNMHNLMFSILIRFRYMNKINAESKEL